MAIKSSSIAAREEGSWSKVSPRPCGGKSSQRGRQVKALAHCHLDWLCEGQIALLADFWHPLQKLCDRHYPWCCSLCSASTYGRLLHQPVSQGRQSLFPYRHICIYAACPSDLQYLFSFSIFLSHHGHICHCNHNCLQPSLSYNFRLGVGGRMGDNFFQRLLSNKKQIQLWHSHCDEEIGREGKKKY